MARAIESIGEPQAAHVPIIPDAHTHSIRR
jgi:hypothetical protein